MALSHRRPTRSKRSRPDEGECDFDSEKPSKRMRQPASVRLNNVNSVVSALRKSYLTKSDASRAVQMKKYMRNQFEFFGIPTPARRGIYPEIYSGMGLEKGDMVSKVWTAEQLTSLFEKLWRLEEREFQHFALDLAEKQCAVLCRDFDTGVKCFRMMIEEKSWWDTVDMVASHLVGYLVKVHSARGGKLMDEWIDCDCMWLRRTAILHQLSYKELCDEKRLFSYCLKRAHEEEFFIRKAIGWALRQYAHTKPVAVKRFVLQNEEKLSTLSKKEALKHLASVKC